MNSLNETGFSVNESKPAEMRTDDTHPSLPWWTWVVPFVVANIATWISLLFRVEPGISLWYLPTAVGIVMVYWWGPRVLLGFYINAVVCTPLWGLPWETSLLSALPGTVEVALSWFLFVKFAKGKPWLPDLNNSSKFLFLGALAPNLIGKVYLVGQLFLLGSMTRNAMWSTWLTVFSADFAALFVCTVPVLILFTKAVRDRGWSLIQEPILQKPYLLPPNRRNTVDILIVAWVFVDALALVVLFRAQELWLFHGFLMVLLAIRYGVYISIIGISWLGALTFLLPAFLASSITGYMDFMTVNFNILFLSTVTLLTGRTVSDLYAEVDEHKMTEETLRLQVAALQAADNGIVITDRDGIIQWANPAFTKLTGYTLGEALGKNPRDLIRSGKHDKEFYKNMWDVILAGQVWHGELINRRKDGTLYTEEMTLTPLKNEEGDVDRFIAIKQDITERVKAEEKLRRAESRYRRLAEQIPPIVYMSDLDQHIGVTYISPRISILGFSPEEWITDPELWLRQIHPDDRAEVMEDIETSKAERKPFKSEYRIRSRDGKVYWFLDEAVDVLDQDGNLAFRQGFMLDITDLKQTETELARYAEEMSSLSQISQDILADFNLERIYTTIHGAVQKLMPCDSFLIALLDSDKQMIEDAYLWDDGRHWPKERQPLGRGLTDFIISSGKTLLVNRWDSSHDEMTKADTFGNPERTSLSVLAVPLTSMTEGCFGMVTVQSYEPDAYTQENEQLLITIASQLAEAVGNARLFAKLQQELEERKRVEKVLISREKYLSLLNEMTRSVLLSSDYDATMQALAVDMKHIMDADDCYILRWDEDKKQPLPVTTTARLDFAFTEGNMPADQFTITGSILDVGHVIAVDDVYNSPVINVEIIQRYPARSIIGIPLIVSGHRLGVVIIAFNTPHKFTEEEIERAEQAGNQVALALWDFQQSVEIQHRLRESDALAEIGRALSETERVGTDRTLKLIVDSARDLIQQAEESVIHLVDVEENALMPRAISGFGIGDKVLERHKMRLGEGVAGQVIRTGETINVGDINKSDLFLVKGSAPTFNSLLVAPILSGEKRIGTISVQSEKINAFSSRDVELLKALSVQATVAIENSRLFETTQQSLREVNALYQTTQRLASSLEPDKLINDVVSLLYENFGYYHVQIYLLDEASGDIVLKSASGELGARLLEQGFRLQSGSGIAGHAVETATPFVTNNVNNVVFFVRNSLLPDTQSEMAVPIMVEDTVVGVLDIQNTPPNQLTEHDLQLMIAVADQLSVSLQKAGLYKNLQTALQQEQMIRSQLIQSERLAVVGRLLASVSHELNNPLQAIQNALFLLKDEEQLSEQGKQDLDVILSEAERMAVLIERLRSAYRPGHVGEMQPVDLNGLIEDVHALIATHMRQKMISLEFHPDPGLPPVSGFADQLRQVALNLFINGVEAMKPGDCLTVQTYYIAHQKEALFIVKDTGPGIDQEILPNIFDAFTTNKRTGTGLGLTITHEIIQRHQGRIEAANDPQGGAVFKIWLPIHEGGSE